MYTLNRFCCVCFCFKNDLKSIPPQNNIYQVHFEKLLSDIPDSSALTQKLICEICRNVIDEFSNFYTKCLTNHGILVKHLTQLQFEHTGLANIVIKTEPVDTEDVGNCPTVNETFKNTTDLKSNSYVSHSDENNFSGIFPKKPTDVFNTVTCNVIKEEPLDVDTDDYYTDNIKVENIDDTNIQLTDSVQSMKNELNEIHDEEEYKYFDEVESDMDNSQSASDYIVVASEVVKDEFSQKYEEDDGTYVKFKTIDVSSYNSNQLTEKLVPETVHNIGSHNIEKQFSCTECDYKTNDRKCLTVHKLRHGPKLHACEYCDKKFYNSANLKRHIRVHTGERPYACKVCGKTFKDSSDLCKHKLSKSHDLSERQKKSRKKPKEHTCEVCGKVFYKASALTVHKRIHTGEKPYPCKSCHMKFTNSGSLKKHAIIHTEEKPFSCEVCGKQFRRSDNVTTHMRTHTGEKPYSCLECGKRFSTTSIRNLHMKSHKRDIIPADSEEDAP